MFKKKKLNPEEMTAEEMRAFRSGIVKRILWVNGLWLLFVVFILFWKTGIGIFLLVITAIKYVYDYHDVESQAVFADLEVQAINKKVWEQESDRELLHRNSKTGGFDE